MPASMPRALSQSSNEYSITTLFDMYRQQTIDFNLEYQRSYIWKIRKKQRLIDSILRGYDINKVFFRQRIDIPQRVGILECLDGQQRLRTIFDFLQDGFAIGEMTPFAEGRKFSELPEDMKRRIEGYVVSATVVTTSDDWQTCDIFLRLQEGVPLNAAEKLNATKGKMRDIVVRLSRHPVFSSSPAKIGISMTRFSHRLLVAQVLALELAGQPCDAKYKQLSGLYEQYRTTGLPRDKVAHVRGILHLLRGILGNDCQLIRHRADFISVYWALSVLRKDYAIGPSRERIRRFFDEFFSKLAQMSDRAGGGPTARISGEEELRRYLAARSTSIDSQGSIQQRHAAIMELLLDAIPDLKLLDDRRAFTDEQRVVVYRRAGGRCERCGIETPLNQGQAHHKVPHSEGGHTEVQNGQWLCNSCHEAVTRAESQAI